MKKKPATLEKQLPGAISWGPSLQCSNKKGRFFVSGAVIGWAFFVRKDRISEPFSPPPR